MAESELWLEFLSPGSPGHVGGHCGLCGNYGVIDTRGKIYTPAGYHAGVLAYCICPNGRSWKDGGADMETLLAPKHRQQR